MVGALLVALVTLGAVLALQARSAYRHLEAASRLVPVLRGEIATRDEPGARATLTALHAHVAAARAAVHGPQWSLVAALPRVGVDVTAVQTLTAALDTLATGADTQLRAASQYVVPADLAPVGGVVPLGPVERVAPHLAALARDVAVADRRLAGIDTGALLPPLRVRVEQVRSEVGRLAALAAPVADAARLIPSMLGADGPRYYLVLEQNNAEPRALGGITGAVVLLRADRGKLTLVAEHPGAWFGDFRRPVLPLTSAEQALHGTQLGRFMQNVTGTPDFPRAAALAREMWRRKTGRLVDGVAAVDPYALQLVLRATGPVTLRPGAWLTGDNTAAVLLDDVYRTLPDPAAQDRFFAAAAGAVFAQVASGVGDHGAEIQALGTAVHQGRLLLWSAHAGEQAVLAGTAISGELRGDDHGRPVVGVYLHDGSASKIGYYQHVRVRTRAIACDADSVRRLAVAVTVANRVPADVAALPTAVTGGGRVVGTGYMQDDVLLYAPAGAVVTSFRAGGDHLVRTYVDSGLRVVSHVVSLAPGRSVTLRYRIDVPARLHGDAVVRLTPGPTPEQFSVSAVGCRPRP